MYKVFSLINAPTLFFLWEKADQNAIKMALIPQTFLIFVQNLSERMPFLVLLNCNAAEESLLTLKAWSIVFIRLNCS